MSNKAAWNAKLNKDALSFIKILVKKLTYGKIQVLHSGWYEKDGQFTFRVVWSENE
jgi:hypothetical protein